jgi:dynein heavy chain, axonemal
VKEFKVNFEEKGPKAKGITPKEASDRLTHFENDYELKKTFYDINRRGENLFGLQNQEYPDLMQIKSEIDHLGKLYELYNKVNSSTSDWEEETWAEIKISTINEWEDMVIKYSETCNNLPTGLKGW